MWEGGKKGRKGRGDIEEGRKGGQDLYTASKREGKHRREVGRSKGW